MNNESHETIEVREAGKKIAEGVYRLLIIELKVLLDKAIDDCRDNPELLQDIRTLCWAAYEKADKAVKEQ